MALSERLNEDMKQAMRDQDKFRLSVIRLIRSAMKNFEIEQRRTLNDDDVLNIINREVKQRKDSLQDFEKAGREDLVEKINLELAIVTEYLPQQLSELEVKSIVQETIREVGASSKADMGKVMGALMPKVKGRADGRLINQIVQEELQ
jgi:uncharacterized protein YqeY